MSYRFFYKNFFVILIIDVILLTGAIYAAHLIRFDFDIPLQYWAPFNRLLPLILITKILCFYFFDLYRGMWRYTSIADLLNVIKAATLSTLVIFALISFSTRLEGFSRSIFIIDWCLTILFISGCRLCIRLYFEHISKDKTVPIPAGQRVRLFQRKKTDIKQLLIIGAGNCGEKIYREIRDNMRLQYHVVGFLDDDSNKIGKKIHGIPVIAPIQNISMITKTAKIDEALIAIPSASSGQIREIVSHCKQSGINFKTVPSMGELINGRVTVNAIRNVDYRDLLGREIIRLDEEQIGAYLKKQTVLVTGAGGSIGAELCRQISRFRPECIVLYERAETPLYDIALELNQTFKDIRFVPLLADIQDMRQLKIAFEKYRPQTVFHAAAYKHVPMLEMQPWKAVRNNIHGTLNVVETARNFAIERFVFVSTDKAVRPANVMGASKRVVEMLVQGQNGCGLTDTRFMIVRFGNVVGSVGSVVPLFKKQIETGGPVTVTHPDVTRYFMTIPEACQLILQAGAMGNGGEIFLLDMGQSIKIDDMARDLIRLSGFEPDVDIKVEYIGLRPGEKLYEELIIEGEGIVPTSHDKIMVLKGMNCNLNFLNGQIKELFTLADNQDEENIKLKLREIVPEYQAK